MNCILKKFLLKTVNKTLESYKDDVVKTRETVSLWTNRTRKLLSCLESLSQKLDDNQIDGDELQEVVSEIESLVKEW